MAIQLAIGQRCHISLSSEHLHRRAMALGVSLILGLGIGGCNDQVPSAQTRASAQSAVVATAGNGFQATAPQTPATTSLSTATAPSERPSTSPAVAVLAESKLSIYSSDVNHLHTVDVGRVASPVLWCWKSSVLIIGTDSWGKLGVPTSMSDITWSTFAARPKGCLNPVLQVRQVTPSASGALCVTVADGFADTFTCEQTYDFDPVSGRHSVGCQIAAFASKSANASSPSGRYQTSFDTAIQGDDVYFRSATLVDHQTERSVRFDSLNVLQREAVVTWLPDEQAVVLAGKLVTLPAMSVEVEGGSACVVYY